MDGRSWTLFMNSIMAEEIQVTPKTPVMPKINSLLVGTFCLEENIGFDDFHIEVL